jgi:hypothetical protein
MDGRAAGHNFERGPSKFGLNCIEPFENNIKPIKVNIKLSVQDTFLE